PGRPAQGRAAPGRRRRAGPPGGARVGGGEGGGAGDAAGAHEGQDLGEQAGTGPAGPALGAGDHLDGIGPAGARAARLPDVDLVTAAVAHVLDPPGVTDHRVVAEVVRGEVALLVRGQHPVVEPHLDHRYVLDVDHGVQLLLGGGRPDVRIEPVPQAPVRVVATVGDVPVHGEIADAGDAAGVPAGQPVDDVDVV